MTPPLRDALRALALLAVAAVAAGLANGLARPDRKLAWTGWAPPPAAPAAVPMPAPPVPVAPAPAPAPVPRAAQRPAPAAGAPKARTGIPASQPPPAAPKAPPAPQPQAAPAAAPGGRFGPAPDAPVRDLSSDDAWAAWQQRAPFLDARRSAEYQEDHVAGAFSVPVWEADAAARITEFEARANPAPAAPIVVYCSGGDCNDSRILAQKLLQLGYRNLLIYRDGFPDWLQRGRPHTRGARP